MKSLVTAGGGISIKNWFLLLKDYGYEVFSADMRDEVIGKKYSDAHFQAPAGTEESFITFLNDFSKYNVDLILPLVDEEVVTIGKNLEKIRIDYNKFFVPLSPDCFSWTDKLLLKEQLPNQLNYPETYNLSEIDISAWHTFPCILKPRTGRGSRGLHVCQYSFDLAYFYEKLSRRGEADHYIIQRQVTGKHIYFDIVVEKTHFYWIGREEIRIYGNAIFDFRLFWHEKFNSFVSDIIKILQNTTVNSSYIINVDAIIDSEMIWLIEINPRPSVQFPNVFSQIPLLKQKLFHFFNKIEPQKHEHDHSILNGLCLLGQVSQEVL